MAVQVSKGLLQGVVGTVAGGEDGGLNVGANVQCAVGEGKSTTANHACEE